MSCQFPAKKLDLENQDHSRAIDNEKKDSKEPIEEPPSVKRQIYSPETIKLLINLNGIDDLSLKMSKDTSNRFHLYLHSEQVVANSLLRDSIDYFLTQGTEAGDRRVAFLIRTTTGCFSFIVECTGLDTSKADALRTFLIANGINTADKILAIKPVAEHFMRLYSNINCLVLGAKDIPELRSEIITMMQLAYGKASLRFGGMDILNSSPLLIERTLSILKGTTVKEVDLNIVSTYKMSLINTLQELLALNVKHQEVARHLIIICKYHYLALERQKLSESLSDNLNVLEPLQNKYKLIKAAVFQMKIDMKPFLERFELEQLSQILRIEDNPQMLVQLKEKCNEYVTSNRAWERALANKITAQQAELKHHKFRYLRHHAAKSLNFLYENSLIAVGKKLLPGLFRPFIPHFSASVLPVKNFLMKAALIMSHRLPSKLSKKSHEMTRVILNNIEIESILGATGASVGVAYYYSGTFYELMRQIFVVSVLFKINHYLTQPIFDDERAQAIEKVQRGYLKDTKTLFNAINIAVSLIEAVCSKDYQATIITVGGMAGNLSAGALVTWLFPKLRTINGSIDEEQIIIARLLAAHFIGQRLGQHLAKTGVDLFSLSQAHQKAIDAFLLYLGTPEGIEQYPNASVYIGSDLYRTPFIQRLSFLDSLRSWFNQEPPLLTVECCPPKQLYFSVTCKVLASNSEATIACCSPLPLNPARNPLFSRAIA